MILKLKKAYKNSTFSLTKEVANKATWGSKEIEDRQKELAKIAVKTWPIAAP